MNIHASSPIPPSSRLILRGGRVLVPGQGLVETDLAIADGRIERLAPAGRLPGRSLSADGLLVLPGIVDLHGDGFEKLIMPRSGARFETRLALAEADKHLLAAGITTAYFAVSCTWEPGLRSLEGAGEFVETFAACRAGLGCDARLHLRFELCAFEAVAAAEGWLDAGLVDLLAFNDHVPHIASRLDSPAGLAVYAERTGLDPEEFAARFELMRERSAAGLGVAARLAAAARRRGLPMASHDDETPEMRRAYRALGSTICEFPVDASTAASAREAGDPVVLGAPNALSGNSLYGRLQAGQALAAGQCTALASDYFYPSLLHAPFRLAREGIMSFEAAWEAVSAGPAAALGLSDRGAVAPGRRADLVLVDASDPDAPRVVATLVAGRLAYASWSEPSRQACEEAMSVGETGS